MICADTSTTSCCLSLFTVCVRVRVRVASHNDVKNVGALYRRKSYDSSAAGVPTAFSFQLFLFWCMCESINSVIKSHHKQCAEVNESGITTSLHQLARRSMCCLSSYTLPRLTVINCLDWRVPLCVWWQRRRERLAKKQKTSATAGERIDVWSNTGDFTPGGIYLFARRRSNRVFSGIPQTWSQDWNPAGWN